MIVEVLLILALVAVISAYIRFVYTHFSKEGIPHAPFIPLFGSQWRSLLRRVNIAEDVMKIYRETGDDKCRYVGLYQFTSPIILLKDPEIIKQITVKDFDHFTDHQSFGDSDSEELFSRNLFGLKGQKWRDMRATLSPAFTSLKIKNMCAFISDCGRQMNKYVSDRCVSTGRSEIELRDLTCRYMNDVIASTAFGLSVDSFKDKENQFYLMGKKVTNVSTWMFIKIIIKIWVPNIARIIKIDFFGKDVNDFFRHLVMDTMDYREKEKVIRPDMIHLLMEAKKGSLKHETVINDRDAGFATVDESEIGTQDSKRVWTDDDLVAQAILFFFAGFDTASTMISFILYEVALNQDIHRKLQAEIDDCMHSHGGKITYEMIQKMKYVDMVVSEGLRKWPPAGQIDRACVKDYNLGPYKAGETASYTIKKGAILWLPIMALQRDPKYWENPEKYDPERFSDDNKHNINPLAYIPFGAGPRNCIGSRFALVEMKIFLIHLLSDFNVEPSPKTPIPLVLATDVFNLRPKDGFHLNFIRRKV